MKFRYCTECGAPLQQRDATEYVCANGHEYWNEPHASACVAVLRNGHVLLARRGIEPRKGRYVLPGGFVEFDETPYEAARRIRCSTAASPQSSFRHRARTAGPRVGRVVPRDAG